MTREASDDSTTPSTIERKNSSSETPSATIVEAELRRQILWSLGQGRPIYLDRFGLLYKRSTRSLSRLLCNQDSQLALREEEKHLLCFEKCAEITSYHRERFPNLIESTELAARIFSQLQPTLSLEWPIRRLEVGVRSFARALKHDVVTNGWSNRLGELGKLYAIHNRQGHGFADWFAGSDIFLAGAYEWIEKAAPWRIFDCPLIDDPKEILEAAVGPCIAQRNLNLEQELLKLGYEFNPTALADVPAEMPIDIFRSQDKEQLVFSTNGLRHLGVSQSSQLCSRTELVVQVAADKTGIPDWPLHMLALGWMLLICRKSRSLKSGSAIAVEAPSSAQKLAANIQGIISTKYSRIPYSVASRTGSFSFINLAAVTTDELRLAQRLSSDVLIDILSARGLDQTSKPNRSSVLSRSSFGLIGQNIH